MNFLPFWTRWHRQLHCELFKDVWHEYDNLHLLIRSSTRDITQQEWHNVPIVVRGGRKRRTWIRLSVPKAQNERADNLDHVASRSSDGVAFIMRRSDDVYWDDGHGVLIKHNRSVFGNPLQCPRLDSESACRVVYMGPGITQYHPRPLGILPIGLERRSHPTRILRSTFEPLDGEESFQSNGTVAQIVPDYRWIRRGISNRMNI